MMMNVQSFFLDVLASGGSVMNMVLFNSLVLAVGASFLVILLKWLPIRSSAINQSLWFLVLLAGVVFFRVPIDVPSPFSGTSHSGERVFQRGDSRNQGTRSAASNGFVDDLLVVEASVEKDLKFDKSPDLELENRSPSARIQPAMPITEAVKAGGVAAAPIVPEVDGSRLLPVSQPDAQTLSIITERDSATSPALKIADRAESVRRETSETPLRDSWPLGRTLFVGWISGGLLLVLASILRLWKFRQFVSRDEVSPADEREVARWTDEWNAICRDLKVRRIPRLCFTKSVGPGLCPGITRPSLVLPVSLWEKLDRPQREAVLRHEAAHLVRRDLWRSLLVRLLALPHWFNPFAWLAVRRFEEAAEWACDEAATNSSIETGCEFAELLVSMTKRGGFRPVVAGQPLATNGSLKERITRLIQSDDRPHRSLWRTAIVLTVPCFVLAASAIDVRLVAQSDVPSVALARPADETPAASTLGQSDHHPADVASPRRTRTPIGNLQSQQNQPPTKLPLLLTTRRVKPQTSPQQFQSPQRPNTRRIQFHRCQVFLFHHGTNLMKTDSGNISAGKFR